MVEWSEHGVVINIFYGVSITYTVASILNKVGFSRSYVFDGVNLTLYTVTSIHSIQKRTRIRNSETSGRWQNKIQKSKERKIELVS